MRIAIAGGTGLVGRHVDRALRQAGHDTVVVARSTGVDLVSGAGLADALAGVEAVVDTTNPPAASAGQPVPFFTTVARNLTDAGRNAGVGHYVVLSIVGLDKVDSNDHYLGKRSQEATARAGAVPVSVVRTTQFFEFAEQMVGWTRSGDEAKIPPLLIQPLAAADAGAYLAQIAVEGPQERVHELAGPERQDLVDMTRRILSARGADITLIPSWQAGPFDVGMAGDVLLPSPAARIAPTDLQTWLTTEGPAPRAAQPTR